MGKYISKNRFWWDSSFSQEQRQRRKKLLVQNFDSLRFIGDILATIIRFQFIDLDIVVDK